MQVVVICSRRANLRSRRPSLPEDSVSRGLRLQLLPLGYHKAGRPFSLESVDERFTVEQDRSLPEFQSQRNPEDHRIKHEQVRQVSQEFFFVKTKRCGKLFLQTFQINRGLVGREQLVMLVPK